MRTASLSSITRLAALTFALTACATVQLPGLEPLVTDRPDFTESADVVGRGLMQVESGSTFTKEGGESSGSLGEMLVRAGFGDRGELRVGLNSYTLASYGDGLVRGLEDMSLGAKFSFLKGGGKGSWLPSVSMIGASSLPTGSSAWRSDKLQPEVKLVMGWELSDRVAFTSNVNYSWVRERYESWGEPAASGSLGVTLTDKVGSYFEYYGFFPQYFGAEKSHFLNGGLTYGITDNLQLDARLGQGVGAVAKRGPDYFFGFGIARRW